ADPLGSRQAPDSPTLALGRSGVKRGLGDLPDLAAGDPSPGASSWSGGGQGGETALVEAPPPEQYRHQRGAQGAGHAPAGDPGGGEEDEARSGSHLCGGPGGGEPRVKDAVAL